MYSIHPYKPYIPKHATKIIVGSIPPYRFCVDSAQIYKDDVRFYYGSNKNQFWKLVGEVTDTKFDFLDTSNAIDQRKRWLDMFGIGITDVVFRCIHEDGKSDDNSLKDIEYNRVDELLLKFPRIDTIICTSEFVRVHLKNILDCKYYRDDKRNGKFLFNGRLYNVIMLYSPSPSALRGMGVNGKEKRKEQYRCVFSDV